MLSEEKRERIAIYKSKWKEAIGTNRQAGTIDVRPAIRSLLAELSIGPPAEFLHVSTLDEALSSYGDWKHRIGRTMTMYWRYQLPLCEPRCYWRQFGRQPIHFGARRKPNDYRCYASLMEGSANPTIVLSKELHEEIWNAFGEPPCYDACNEAMVEEIWNRHEAVWRELQDAMEDEDPSCPCDVTEFLCLGPYDWLVREVACVEFCQVELGIARNAALYNPLASLLRWGGLALTFEKLCVLCERPFATSP